MVIIIGSSKRIKSEIIGERYGNFTVLEYAGRYGSGNKSHWKCKCDCGNIVYVCQNNLLRGSSTQCKECSSKRKAKPLDDRFIGKKFGKLTVLEYVGNRKYRCLCECGKEKNIIGGSLTSGNTTSCGCSCVGQNGSKQEYAMKQIVVDVFGEDNVLDVKRVGNYRPDCILCYNDTLYDIEYDGAHWHNEEHDAKRDNYFIEHGYRVLRFICKNRTISKQFVRKEQLLESINYMVENNIESYKKIL